MRFALCNTALTRSIAYLQRTDKIPKLGMRTQQEGSSHRRRYDCSQCYTNNSAVQDSSAEADGENREIFPVSPSNRFVLFSVEPRSSLVTCYNLRLCFLGLANGIAKRCNECD